MNPESGRVLHGHFVINTGSSSLKLTFYGNEPQLPQHMRISVERIGQPGSRLAATSVRETMTEAVDAKDHAVALRAALNYVKGSFPFAVDAVGHRVVFGGVTHVRPERVTPKLLADLRQLTSVDPSHMPQALDAIDVMAREYPTVPQVACFDTAFHRTMPLVAQRYALPAWTATVGVQRYGFHGLSCEFILSALERRDPDALRGRLLIAHLGNGASVTAVQRGVSIETTMGFSPTSGLMMGTRSGDLDPTVMTYLARTAHRDVEALHRLVNEESGLLGVSGVSSDIRDLLGAPESSPAAQAIELFCYTARKHIGALAAVLDGVDTIVFTGGIGEHASAVRAQICEGLGFLGLRLDPEHNAANHEVISASASKVSVRVIETDEELMIARHVRHVLA
jgi:acetate kinase